MLFFEFSFRDSSCNIILHRIEALHFGQNKAKNLSCRISFRSFEVPDFNAQGQLRAECWQALGSTIVPLLF